MNARSLLAEVRAANVSVHADGHDLVVRAPRGALTEKLRARLAVAKAELLAVLRAEQSESDASYDARELACYRGYVAALGRAYGFDEETIARAVECLARRSGAFRVTPERIEIELAGAAKAVFVRAIRT